MSVLSPRPATFLADDARRQRIRLAFLLFRDAWEAACDLEAAPEDFALEAIALYQKGLTQPDLRWLMGQGFILHLHETTRGRSRTFRPSASPKLTSASCFVIADGDQLVSWETLLGATRPLAIADSPDRAAPCIPRWDKDGRRLLYQGQLVKWFRVPAPNQELILDALEEDGWPPQIDDPLPVVHHIRPCERLQDALKALNRAQLHPLLLFRSNGTGSGITWHPRDAGSDAFQE